MSHSTRHPLLQQLASVTKGDITQRAVDAVVNAANTSLLGGGGVDGAIHAAAGPELLAACRALQGCATGQAKITPAFRLPATYVIHTVGPVWQGGDAGEPAQLASCYQSSLTLAAQHRVHSIAFPAISTGVYGYPLDRAATVALQAVEDWLAEQPEHGFKAIEFVCFDAATAALYEPALAS